MPSKHLVLCCALLLLPSIFPSIRSYTMSQLFALSDQSIRASDSASVSPMNIQDWFPLGLTGLISLQSKGLKSLLQHHSLKASTLRCSAFFTVQLSHSQNTVEAKIHFTLLLNNVVPYTIPVSSASFLKCLILLSEHSCPLLPLLRNQSIWELCLWTSPGRAAMYRSLGCSLEKSIQVKEPLRAKIYSSFHSGD